MNRSWSLPLPADAPLAALARTRKVADEVAVKETDDGMTDRVTPLKVVLAVILTGTEHDGHWLVIFRLNTKLTVPPAESLLDPEIPLETTFQVDGVGLNLLKTVAVNECPDVVTPLNCR